MKCGCGETLRVGAQFCTRCGAPVDPLVMLAAAKESPASPRRPSSGNRWKLTAALLLVGIAVAGITAKKLYLGRPASPPLRVASEWDAFPLVTPQPTTTQTHRDIFDRIAASQASAPVEPKTAAPNFIPSPPPGFTLDGPPQNRTLDQLADEMQAAAGAPHQRSVEAFWAQWAKANPDIGALGQAMYLQEENRAIANGVPAEGVQLAATEAWKARIDQLRASRRPFYQR